MEIETRVAPVVKGRALALMSFSALGIVFADIGTSPLYVLNGIFPAAKGAPSSEDALGAVSAILWALTLLPLIKYSLIALSFGTNQGEGGVFALFIGLFPRSVSTGDGRALTQFSTGSSKSTAQGEAGQQRVGYRTMKRARWPLMILAFFGTALTMADGVLTPAVSLTSAVGGLAVPKPAVLEQVVPISLGFLAFIFLIQRFGAHRISVAYAPVTAIWLLLLGGCGITNIVSHPAVFRAFDPSRAVMFFVRTRNYDALAGILLSVTGCEGLYSNLGSFNAPSIRCGFLFVYVNLILAYLGQASKMITDGEGVISNLFYQTIPGPANGALFWVVWVFGLLATIIASQTMISATFSLVEQLISFKAFPALRKKQTSETWQGHVYFPAVNYLLMVATLATVGGFKTSTALTNAYGFAVSAVMLCTTTLLTLQIPFVKNLPWALALAFFVFFAFVDGLFFGASLRKVPHGAWFPLGIGCLLAGLMTFYAWGRELEDAFDERKRTRLSSIIFRRSALREEKHVAFEPVPDDTPAASTSEQDSDIEPLELTKPLTKHTPNEIRYHEVDGKRALQERPTISIDEDLFLAGPTGYLDLPRVKTLAIFHEQASNSHGVPHSFYATLRLWPALPRVVVFASTRIVGIPHVALEDRYSVIRVRSVEGFYGCVVSAGYRDAPFDLVTELLPRIAHLERQANPERAEAVVAEITQAARNATHIQPSYVLRSMPVPWAPWRALRRVLIEELYGRLRLVFPDVSSNEQDDSTVHVGVVAHI